MTEPRTHVLLDLDGTLSDSEPGILRSLQWACEQEGFPVPTEAEVRSVIGPPLEIGLPCVAVSHGLKRAHRARLHHRHRKADHRRGLSERQTSVKPDTGPHEVDMIGLAHQDTARRRQ